MDALAIQRILPHRPPFLLVDQIISWTPGQRAVGIKNVTANEPALSGHFPGYPIFPGVLIVEALAQVGALLLLSAAEEGVSGERGGSAEEEGPFKERRLPLFAGIDRVRFRRPVHPGDCLRLEVQLLHRRGWTGKASAIATVNEQRTAEGELRFALVPHPLAAQQDAVSPK